MILYTWAVWQNNRLVGYVESSSEWNAIRLAHSKYGSCLYVERCLMGVGPKTKEKICQIGA